MHEKRWIAFGLLCVCLTLALGCEATGARTTEGREAPRYAVEFRDRQIDLEPFLIGFPYSGHRADLKRGHMFYLERAQDGLDDFRDLVAGPSRLAAAWGRRFGGGRAIGLDGISPAA